MKEVDEKKLASEFGLIGTMNGVVVADVGGGGIDKIRTAIDMTMKTRERGRTWLYYVQNRRG